MKRISHIALFLALAALVYVNLGDLARIGVGLAGAKMEANANIAQANRQTTLHISNQEFASGQAAMIGNTEVRYHGHLYDIANSQQDGNTVSLTVTADEKEEGLLSELTEHVEQWFNNPVKPTNKNTNIKHTDLLKDFIPVNKLSLYYASNSVGLHQSFTAPTISMVLPVAENPPRVV